MDYRGPVFLAPSYNLAPSSPPTPSSVSKLAGRHTGRVRKRDNLLTEEVEGVKS
jgi:hypothetical protein